MTIADFLDKHYGDIKILYGILIVVLVLAFVTWSLSDD